MTDEQTQNQASLSFPVDTNTKITLIGMTKEVLNTLGISTVPANGKIPIGNGVNYSTALLTAGTGITITNAAGSITIAASSTSGFKSGIASRSFGTGSGTQTIAHGLGATPKYIRITAFTDQGTGAAYGLYHSVGTYDGTSHASLVYNQNEGSYSYWLVSSNTSYIVKMMVNKNQDGLVATASLDATNITLSWTLTGTPSGTIYFLWEAYK